MKANYKYKKRSYIGFVLILIILNSSVIGLSFSIIKELDNSSGKNPTGEKSHDLKSQGIYEEEFTEQWLKNRFFEKPITPWHNISQGDISDLNATSAQNQANFQVLGDKGTFSLVADPPTGSNWVQKTNPNFPFLPDTYTINQDGFYVSHYWDEGADQSPGVHWDHNVTLAINMSDYIITSASINAICNATVTTPSSQPYSDGVDTPYDDADPWFQVATGDNIRFYILISDLQKDNVFEIAYNQTYNLGRDSPAISTMMDTLMESVPEETLIYYLTQVLSSDFQNFTITAGIRIWCEDNFPQDSDRFNDIIINHLNLTFTYVKNIDQLSSLAWNQIGNKISGSNVEITEAILSFNYKVDQLWPGSSPNSEIRILINGSLHSETVKLSSATTVFQEAKAGGFDVTYLIKKNVNISLSIQLFIGDNFGLDQMITLSVDNASLVITYIITSNEEETHLSLFLNNQNKTLSGYLKLPLDQTLNISIIYDNSLHEFIFNASVFLFGLGSPKNLTENTPKGHYYILINTTDLNLGQNYLSITANKFRYETRDISFIIDVTKKSSYIDKVFLNSNPTNSINILWNSTLEIAITYNDSLSNKFITGAIVELFGTGISKTFIEEVNNYKLTINTAELEFGSNYLTINAVEDNHLSNSTYIIVDVVKREANLQILINGLDESSFEYYNSSIGQMLNLTVFYKDSITGINIDDSDIELYKATDYIGQFSEHAIYSQYNYSILTDSIGNGIKILTITAEKENYTQVVKELKLIIGERATELYIFLNGSLTADNGNYTLQIGDSLNITAQFQDSFTGNHLSGAIIELLSYGNFIENLLNESFYYLIDAGDLTQGFTYLTIIAQLNNYESQSLDIILEVEERGTQFQVYLNDLNKTSDRYYELPIGKTLNVTVKYFDTKTKAPIDGASISFQGDLSYSFQEYTSFHQYTYVVNTTELDIGVSILTVLFLKDNYQPQNPDLTIVVRRINSTITTESGESLLNAVPGQDYTLKIKLINEDFGGFIYNASVMYSWQFGQGTLEDDDNDGIYTETLRNLPVGAYKIVITVYAGDDYNFNRFEVTLNVESTGDSGILTALWVLIPILCVLVASFVLYEKKYKVPKPIRKLRKYRKTLKKEKGVESINIINRDTAINELYKKSLDKLSKLPKIKTSSREESSLLKEDANILAKD